MVFYPIQFIFWAITLIATWYIQTFNILPANIPSWIVPVTGILVGYWLSAIGYSKSAKEEGMEARILMAIAKSNSEVKNLVTTFNKELKELIKEYNIEQNARSANTKSELLKRMISFLMEIEGSSQEEQENQEEQRE